MGAEKGVEEVLKKYLGVSVPRLVLGVLMLLFGVLILVKPEIVAWLVGLYLLISGVIVIAEELMKRKSLKS